MTSIEISDDRARMDVAVIHAFLSQESYWAKNVPREVVECTDAQRVRGLRRWHLVTRDAHALYAQFGFTAVDVPERHMMKLNPLSPVAGRGDRGLATER